MSIRDAASLRAVRAELLRTLWRFESAQDLLELQLRLVSEIKASEASDGEDERDHRDSLRNIGDGVAWKVLTAHAIRNLSVTGRQPPSLLSQGAAFDHVCNSAPDR